MIVRRRYAWLLIVVLISPVSIYGQARRAKVLLSGDIYPCPVITLCVIDPLYEYVPLQTREIPQDDAKRYARLYFPRTRELLFEYSMLFFVDCDMSPFSGKQVSYMLQGIEEGHLGTFWTFGPHYGSVASSDLQQVIPHEMSKDFNSWAWGHDFYRVIFRRERPPVFTPFVELGLENVRAYGCGQLSPRIGTTIWGDMLPWRWPWMVTWEFGGTGGLCWVAADDLDHPFWERTTYGFTENKYPVDILANIITYTVGGELPDDVLLPIYIRRELQDFNNGRNLFVSVLEFVEKFGADTGELYDELLTIDAGVFMDAKVAYMEGDYPDALSMAKVGNEEIKVLVDRALEARERALMWIFVIEWLTVSGTSMISGFVLWTLMVRRRIYREVETTRLQSVGG
jgi:hypothetical protein